MAASVQKLTYEDIQVGDWIVLTKERCGRVVWKGDVEFKTKTGDKRSIGVELKGTVGKHDGKWPLGDTGKRYFTCEENRGMIVQMDRVRKKLPGDPTKSKMSGKGSSQDLSKFGISSKALGIKEAAKQAPEKQSEFQGWGSWNADEVLSYVNKRLTNYGEKFADAGIDGSKIAAFRDDQSKCKDFFRDLNINPAVGKSLYRFLKNDLTDDIKS